MRKLENVGERKVHVSSSSILNKSVCKTDRRHREGDVRVDFGAIIRARQGIAQAACLNNSNLELMKVEISLRCLQDSTFGKNHREYNS